jgi:hypothetical protein
VELHLGTKTVIGQILCSFKKNLKLLISHFDGYGSPAVKRSTKCLAGYCFRIGWTPEIYSKGSISSCLITLVRCVMTWSWRPSITCSFIANLQKACWNYICLRWNIQQDASQFE